MTPSITLSDKPDPAAIKAIHAGLLAFNDQASGYAFDMQYLLITVADAETKEIVGGLFGATAYGYLRIDMVYLPEPLRRQGLGAQLMQQAEDEARRRGCRGSYLDTFDFQARGFYERLGYTLTGTLEDTPPGHTRFFLKKQLGQG
jgi:GNAT superfamily N-acetyltransferase